MKPTISVSAAKCSSVVACGTSSIVTHSPVKPCLISRQRKLIRWTPLKNSVTSMTLLSLGLIKPFREESGKTN